MPFLTLRQAAAKTGVDKMTISRAIKRGDLSATRTGKGGAYQIDPAELFRVYPEAINETAQKDNKIQADTSAQSRDLSDLRREIEFKETRIEQLETERRREREMMQETIDDLRQRLDRESEERSRLTLMVTDHSEDNKHPKKPSVFRWFR